MPSGTPSTLTSTAWRKGHEQEIDEEIPATDQATAAVLPDLPSTLRETYAAAEQNGTGNEEGCALVNMLRLDLDLMIADL